MPDAESATERRDGAAADEAASVTTTASDSHVADRELSNGTETAVNDRESGAHDDAKVAPLSPTEASKLSSELKRKRADVLDDTLDGSEPNEFVRQFSLAQVRVQVKRARLEANIAVQEDVKALRFALLQAEQDAQTRAREAEQAEKRCEALQKNLDDVLKLHQRTLLGMRDNLQLETLLASLDKEKSIKQSLRESYQQQNTELLRAQQRIASLETQIAKYQKNETVLAQSITHFQEQYASKDHERAAMIDRVRRELEAQHVETRLALETEAKMRTQENEALQVQLQQLQAEHVGLQETAQAVVEMQEKREAELEELRTRAAQFDTEKEVLSSKLDQVQKADAQLRSKIQALEEQVVQMEQDNALLRSENVELGKIATDLMDMAEQQHAEKQMLLKTPDKEGDERLARTRTRLRESLG